MTDLLAHAKEALAASSTATDDAAAVLYLSASRAALSRVEEELRQLAILVAAREAELARRVQPAQLSIETEVRP
jgi:hypothetical protein